MNTSANSKKFYKLFWSNQEYRNVFLVHKEQLLEKVAIDLGSIKRTYYSQRIIVSNDLKKRTGSHLVTSRLDNKLVDLNKNLEVRTSKYFDESKIQTLVDGHFGKAFDKIEKRLNSGSFSQFRFVIEFLSSLKDEKKAINFLKKHHLLPESVKSFAQIEELLSKSLSTIITKESIIDLIDSIDQVSEVHSSEVHRDLFEAYKFTFPVLKKLGSVKSKIQLFDLLYEAKAIESGVYKTYYECLNCEENVFKSTANLKAKPSKIALRCPVCDRQLFYLSPYRINSELFAHITDQDGIIKYALSQLLIEEGFGCQQNVHVEPDVELDLMATKETRLLLFELKMYKTNTPETTKKSNLNQVIREAIIKREKIGRLKSVLSKAEILIVTNYESLELIKEVRESRKQETRDNNIKLLHIDEFSDYVDYS